MDDCIFCKIVAGQIPADVVFQDDDLLVIRDINPQAPLHVLVIPRKHLADYGAASPEDEPLLGKLARRAAAVAGDSGYAGSGYRTVVNAGPDPGQTVAHLHMHVLAGRPMGWPPWPSR